MPLNVVSQGPWRVGSLVWQPHAGAHTLTVTCCSTFLLAPGESPLVTAPAEPPLEGDDERRYVEPWGPIVPWKRRADVIVVGHAYAPEDAPTSELVARVAVGDVDKSITVRGDSWFLADGSLSAPGLFTRMPLRWERAAGGPRTSNPIGVPMGAEAPSDRWGRVPVPNLLPSGAVIAGRDDVVAPIGFGPIRPEWPTRLDRLPARGAGWDAARWAERPLPDNFDPGYFNVTSRDQMPEDLTGEEWIVLEHLHSRHARLVTRLRAPSPRAVTKINGAEQSIPLGCDTLVIDTDRGRAALVWRGQLALDHPQRDGVVLISAGAVAATSTLPASVAAPAAELPFRRSRPSAPALADHAPVEAPPFEASFSFAPTPLPTGDATETIVPTFKAPTRSLPFRSSPPPQPPVEEPVKEEGEPTPRPSTMAPPPASEPVVAAPAWVLRALPAAAPAAPVVEWTPRPDEAPPPLVGPLAHQVAAPTSEPAVETVAPLEPDPEPALPEDAGPPIEKYPLARSAAIAARIDRRPEEYTQVLEDEWLDLPTWEALDAHWRGAVDADVARGRKKMLAAYDEAYVGALEIERGPITAAEYARLLLASERGAAPPLLDELGLPPAALMRIRRVWLGRTVRDPRAAEALRLALRAASEG